MTQAERLDELLERWEILREQGREISAEELCAATPELLDLTRRRIEAIRAMDWLETPNAELPPCPDRAEQIARGAVSPNEFKTPQTLAGRYYLEQLIAEGGFGQVWRATDTTLERHVAVKLTSVDCLAEARRVARLKHQGIVSVHDVGRQEGFCFIVFDYVEGHDLAWRMEAHDFTWQEAVELIARVAEELHYAHQRGIIHRDIKPANILLDAAGNPLLADFGIAITQSEMNSELVTTAGTLAYMAPEQLQASPEEAVADLRTDIYGLGVVLYRLLTGRLPFEGSGLWSLRARILAGDAAPVVQLNTRIPPAIATICQRCLALQPDDRYQSAQELANVLRAALRDLEDKATA